MPPQNGMKIHWGRKYCLAYLSKQLTKINHYITLTCRLCRVNSYSICMEKERKSSHHCLHVKTQITNHCHVNEQQRNDKRIVINVISCITRLCWISRQNAAGRWGWSNCIDNFCTVENKTRIDWFNVVPSLVWLIKINRKIINSHKDV